MCSYAEGTGRYLLIALLLSTLTVLSQTAFQLYGIFAEPSANSTVAACEILTILLMFDLKPTHRM